MRSAGLAVPLLLALAAAPARGQAPASGPTPAAEPAPPAGSGGDGTEGTEGGGRAAPAERPPGDEDRPPRRTPVAPGDGELPPPRAIAYPPRASRPGWSPDLSRRTSLGLNLLGAGPGALSDAPGTWRVEGVLERAMKPRLGTAGIFALGQVRRDGRDVAWTVEVAGQARWYFLGRFDRGAYVAGTLGFWSVDPYIAWSLGGGVGLKRTFPGGLTVDLLAGLQLPVEWFRHDEGGNPPTLRQAWRALVPGPLVTLGWSFDEGHATSSGSRAR